MDRFDARELTIAEVFSKQGRNFNIPIFQRPYSWGETQCQKLWDDLKNFAIAEKAYTKLEDINCRYFLGPIVVYESDKETHQKEIIDGQQRTTTLLLLLRAFYKNLSATTSRDPALAENDSPLKTLDFIRASLWNKEYSDEKQKDVCRFDIPILKSEVMNNQDFGDFTKIMSEAGIKDDDIDKIKSNYMRTYLQFATLIKNEFNINSDSGLQKIPIWRYAQMILDNCTFLFIDCSAQKAALKIFDTLNNRGMQLRDADILKAAIYQVARMKGSEATEKFGREWSIFSQLAAGLRFIKKTDLTDPMTDTFRQLMMWRKAECGLSGNDIALREFFDSDKENNGNGKAMISTEILADKLIPLAAFWNVVSQIAKTGNDEEDDDVTENVHTEDVQYVQALLEDERALFIQESQKYLQVLGCIMKNAFWRYLLSVFYLKQKDNPDFAEKLLPEFLKKITAFSLYYSITKGADSFKKIVYRKLCDVFANGDFTVFSSNDDERLLASLETLGNQDFLNDFDARKLSPEINRAIVLLHAYLNEAQDEIIPLSAQLEHIFPKSWAKEVDGTTRDNGIYGVTSQDMAEKIFEKFGNKVMLEWNLNNGARDKYFDFKCAIYHGLIPARNIKGLDVKRDENNKLVLSKVLSAKEQSACNQPSKIADVHSIWDNPVWGKAEIEERDRQFKKDIITFFDTMLLKGDK